LWPSGGVERGCSVSLGGGGPRTASFDSSAHRTIVWSRRPGACRCRDQESFSDDKFCSQQIARRALDGSRAPCNACLKDADLPENRSGSPSNSKRLSHRYRLTIRETEWSIRECWRCCACTRRCGANRVRIDLSPRYESRSRNQLRRGATSDGRRRRRFCGARLTYDRLRFRWTQLTPTRAERALAERLHSKRRNRKELSRFTR
jgi:hypothetical protein